MKISLENVGLKLNTSIRVDEYSSTQISNPYHLHKESEIALILRGKGVKIVGERIISYCDRDLSLYGSNLPHSYVSNGSLERENSIVVQFKSDSIESCSIPELEKINSLLKQSTCGLNFTRDIYEDAKKIMFDMKLAEGFERFLLLMRLLDLLSSDTTRKKISETIPFVGGDERIKKAREKMRIEYAERRPMKYYAELSCMSISAFRALFRREYGLSPIEYLLNMRLSESCKMLSDTNKSILEIAEANGFENLSNFNRLFKKQLGMQPSAFRKYLMYGQEKK